MKVCVTQSRRRRPVDAINTVLRAVVEERPLENGGLLHPGVAFGGLGRRVLCRPRSLKPGDPGLDSGIELDPLVATGPELLRGLEVLRAEPQEAVHCALAKLSYAARLEIARSSRSMPRGEVTASASVMTETAAERAA